MGSKNSGRNSSGTPWGTIESKKGRLSVRRYLNTDSYPEARRISKILDDSDVMLERGMLYVPRYIRMTLIGTEELPLGKKYRAADIISRVPSCSERMKIDLGGFTISQIGADKPKLALIVKSKRAHRELDCITEEFNAKDLELRGDLAPNNPTEQNGNELLHARELHLSFAEIDRDQVDYFDDNKLNELNILAGATVSPSGVYMGSVIVNAVSSPNF